MKTSRIIFISLLSTIAVLILAAMIDVRIHGRRNNADPSEFKVNKQLVPSFKVLRLYNSVNVTLVKNGSSFIEMTSLKDSVAPNLNFKLKEDTLYVSDFEKPSHHNVSIIIHATDSLEMIQLKNSDINVERLGLGKLFFDLDQSGLSLNQDTLVKTAFRTLGIMAKNHSKINSSEFRIDSLGLVLRNSEADLEIKAMKISGTLSDSSRISIRQPGEISLKKDGTSKISVNDY
jgi:hypothetical protein